MKLFGKEEINTGRQFEFDMAKALCIFGMVLVHSFEEFATSDAETSLAYYIIVIILDAIFGAATFMGSMGLGISYSKVCTTPDKLIKRGFKIFVLAYILNFFREGMFNFILYLIFNGEYDIKNTICGLICTDILMFAGLALMLLGLLKKLKLPNFAILLISLSMSVVGSFIRFVKTGNYVLDMLLGLFVGTINSFDSYFSGCFPLLNWFIVVVVGYLYGEALRRLANKEKFYAISLPVSGVIIATYMIICIPNKLGVMCDLVHYYHFTTLDLPVLVSGMIFATGLYHYISKLIPQKGKNLITILSMNINKVYCIQWVIIGFFEFLQVLLFPDGLNNVITALLGIFIYIVSNLLAELVRKKQLKRKEAKVNGTA